MKKDSNSFYKKIISVIFAAIIGGLTVYAGLYFSNPAIFKYYDELKVIYECRKVIGQNGSPNFDDEEAALGMINGFLCEGGDKYTKYYDTFKLDTTDYVNSSGTAKASGFSVDMSSDGNILVTGIESGLAADRCGLCVNDVIIEIAGEKVVEKGYDTVVRKLLGKQDTEITMTVLRDGKEVKILFKRDNDSQRNVKYVRYGDTGYISVIHFDDFTLPQFKKALDELDDVSSFIIDLRNCPGGKTNICVKIASFFVNDGLVVLNNYSGDREEYHVEANDQIKEQPVVLLTNEKTASSAEIFTALLKQGKKETTIVGSQTTGKGIFQLEYIFDSGMRLRYTAGEYTVGEWACFQGIGITPDIELSMDSKYIGTNDDIQLKKARELLE